MVHLGLNYRRDDKLWPSSMAVLLKLRWAASTQLLAIHVVSPWLWGGKSLQLKQFSTTCWFQKRSGQAYAVMQYP